MNSVAIEGGFAVMATGHNLDDEVATLFSNTLRWDMDYLSRQHPVLPAAEGFARKVKPFCFFSEKETALYARVEGIPYVYDECPFAAGATSLHMKDVINRLEHDSPGMKRTFLANFLKAKDRLPTAPKPEMRPCKECGAMTPSRFHSPSPERSGGGGADPHVESVRRPGAGPNESPSTVPEGGRSEAERGGAPTPAEVCAFCRLRDLTRNKEAARVEALHNPIPRPMTTAEDGSVP